MSNRTLNYAEVFQLADRLVDADSQTLITAYENRLKELEEQRWVMSEKLAKIATRTSL